MSPVNILNVVVFPAPLIPSKPKHSPVGITRLTSDTASLHPCWQLIRLGHIVAGRSLYF